MTCNLSNDPVNFECLRDVINDVRSGSVNVTTIRKATKVMDSLLATFAPNEVPPVIAMQATADNREPRSLVDQIDAQLNAMPETAAAATGLADAVNPAILALVMQLLQALISKWMTS